MLLIFLIAILFFQSSIDFLVIRTLELSKMELSKIIVMALVAPSLLEELCFRVMLIPHKTEPVENGKRILLSMLSLFLYVIFHPLNSITFYPDSFDTFTDPLFLILVFFVGAICTIAYTRSGSLWLPLVCHWIVVLTWLLLFGGYDLLHEC